MAPSPPEIDEKPRVSHHTPMHSPAGTPGGSSGPERPRLLVVGNTGIDSAEIARALGSTYEVVPTSPDQALTVLATQHVQAILAAADDFLPLERDLVTRHSTILLNAIGEGVCLCSEGGRQLWSNELFRRFDARVRRRITAACRHAVDRFNVGPRAGATLDESRRPRRYSMAFRKINKYYDAVITPVIPDAASGVTRIRQVVAVVRDVSTKRLMQQKIEAISRAGGELVRIESDVVKKMHVAERLKLLEEKVTRFAHELLNFDYFAIRLVNTESQALDLVMSRGLPLAATEIQLFAQPRDNGISGYVAATGRSYICEDCAADPLYVIGIEEAGSSLTVPLKLFERVIGVFNIESEKKNAFTDTDRQFAEIFAQYIAMALHILNLLLVERYTTSETARGSVQGELSEPLNDLVVEAEWLKEQAGGNAAMREHIDRILTDVESIRKRVKEVSRGPRTLLGVDEVLSRRDVDPVLDGKRVLVVDNEQIMLETVRDVLKARGCNVVTSDSGGGAITLLEQWAATHDADEGFDLVVSDINLGDKTGYDVFASAKHADSTLPVILMTGFGYDPHHSIVRASQEGLSCVLFKPFQAEKLVEEARMAVQNRAPRASQ